MKTLLAVLAAAVCTMAAPAHAQRAADLAAGAASYVQPAPAPVAAAPVLAASRDLAPALRPAAVQAPDAAAPRRPSVVRHTVVGAGVGALAGVLASTALFVFDPDCRSGDSMCGLAVPVFIGGGALTGAVTGLVVGLVRHR